MGWNPISSQNKHKAQNTKRSTKGIRREESAPKSFLASFLHNTHKHFSLDLSTVSAAGCWYPRKRKWKAAAKLQQHKSTIPKFHATTRNRDPFFCLLVCLVRGVLYLRVVLSTAVVDDTTSHACWSSLPSLIKRKSSLPSPRTRDTISKKSFQLTSIFIITPTRVYSTTHSAVTKTKTNHKLRCFRHSSRARTTITTYLGRSFLCLLWDMHLLFTSSRTYPYHTLPYHEDQHHHKHLLISSSNGTPRRKCQWRSWCHFQHT